MASSNANWSDQQKRKLMELRCDGQTYESIASTLNKSIKSVQLMCECLDNDQNTASSKEWNDRLLSINAPLITQQQHNENKKEEDEVASVDSNSAASLLSNQQQIPWPAAHNEVTTSSKTKNTQKNNEQQSEQQISLNPVKDKEQTQQNNEPIQPKLPSKSSSKISENEQQSQSQTQPQPQTAKSALDSDRDSDCVIISVSKTTQPQPQQTQTQTPQQQIVATTEKRSIHKSKSVATPIGHQGSAVEYKRLIQKYGQSMRYFVNETVIYFVPRLAQRGRFKDRIGRILKKMDDTESKYEIIDTQNNKKEIVPWKWILKQPKNTNLQKQTSPNSAENVVQIPMHSLSSKEEKLQEFDRRMKRISHCKQYSVPLNDSSQYFDEYEHGNTHTQMPKSKQQIRSLSVFPQRFSEHKKQKLYSPPPPLQRDRVKMQMQMAKMDRNKTKILKTEKKIIDIASSDDVAMDIKKEKISSLSTQKMTKLRRKRSRSRSPSHIRPSNRIINRSLNPGPPRYGSSGHQFVEPFDPYKIGRFGGGYDRDYDRLYFRDHDRTRKVAMDGMNKLPSNKSIRSRSRSRSRERDRERDRNRNYYRREYTPPMAPPTHNYGGYGHDDRRNYTPPHAHTLSRDRHRYDHVQVVREGMSMDGMNGSRLMRSWLSVVDRMRGGSKLTEREITFLCKNDVWPSQIKQLMDSDKRVQEKYDLVAHYLDPSSGQNLSRSQIYSIIGAVITMKF